MDVQADQLDTGARVPIVCAGVLGVLGALSPAVISARGPVEFPVAMKSAPRVTVERVSMERDGGEDGEDGEGDFWVVSVLVLVGLGLGDQLVGVGVGSLLLVVEAMRPLLDGALKANDVEPEEPDDRGADEDEHKDEEDDRLGVAGLVPAPIMLPPLDLIELEDPDLSE